MLVGEGGELPPIIIITTNKGAAAIVPLPGPNYSLSTLYVKFTADGMGWEENFHLKVTRSSVPQIHNLINLPPATTNRTSISHKPKEGRKANVKIEKRESE